MSNKHPHPLNASDKAFTLQIEIAKYIRNETIKVLSGLGFVFQNNDELKEFAKTRLSRRYYEELPQLCELYLDNETLIMAWWDTVAMQGNTVIHGKPPSISRFYCCICKSQLDYDELKNNTCNNCHNSPSPIFK